MSSRSEIRQSPPVARNIDDVLRLEEVSSVRRGRRVLDRVSLSVQAAELVVIAGVRGAGKSTLLALAAAALRPSAGAVYIGGRNVQLLQSGSLPYVRRNIGYLAADPMLLAHESARENVMLALGVRGFEVAVAAQEAEEVLRSLGLADVLDVAVLDLSAGERRLVALARALAGAPAVIVLDDPGAGVADEDRVTIIEALIGARAANSAVLCASGDPAFVRLLVDAGAAKMALQDGRLSAEGPRMRVYDGARASDGDLALKEAEDDGLEALEELELEDLVSS